MRIRACCNDCGRDFLFFHLYNADPAQYDRCPHCSRHLGVLNGRHLAFAADRAAAGLVRALTDIADRNPSFTLNAESVLARIEEAVTALSGADDEPVETATVTPIGRRRLFRRAA
jgi:hypothetical protein